MAPGQSFNKPRQKPFHQHYKHVGAACTRARNRVDGKKHRSARSDTRLRHLLSRTRRILRALVHFASESKNKRHHHAEGGRDGRYLKRRSGEQTRRGQLRIGWIMVRVVLHVIFILYYIWASHTVLTAWVNWERAEPCVQGQPD